MSPRLHRFGEEDFVYWAGRVGPWFDPTGPGGNHLIDGGRLDLTMLVGLYVAVDWSGRCLYVGKVYRRSGGVASRLRAHAQPVERWHSVWLLPLVAECPHGLVATFERALIRRHQPVGNVCHKTERGEG